MDADTADTSAANEHQDISKPALTSTTTFDVGGRGNEENTPPPNRRPLFGSMREALESSGQVKEEPGGYVIKRHSGRPQQFRSSEVVPRSKYRHAKQRSGKDTLAAAAAAPSPEDEADAAGYTVIRRRSSCDESSSSRASASASAASSHSSGAGRRNPRASTPARAGGKKKQQQQQQRPRRGSMSALPSSSLRASVAVPQPSSSVPPGFQPLRPPPGLTQAASGWVVKAAAPAERATKIEEPPVEALWPEMKSTGKTPSGWAASTTSESGGLQAQAWPGPTSSSSAAQKEQEDDGVDDDDDLLARLGVTL
ncbi:hypothetical protein PHYSODRAFT_294860 [Phytophthora sojae]|uniref:Uncharacterized protein n=1 Tax=Phytophthora sojae (strain P6497) TaxID=1094619 RepID=G4YQC3_PHYSP|nr:hypothetical protein PHYSODRAFT_294860 [Phytophthora sojae]EGZ29889.1 hypothetical protein PHYSODRAFT_294860 [Phytophthora sojae]|eukprot:XP_009517164.1 hypothetical protein PHYSODRAFT_294860 [Phytophthora sojae]